eukprot:COSAG03_NODE_6058_length_1122_cov_4.906158_1_plen_65_part_10
MCVRTLALEVLLEELLELRQQVFVVPLRSVLDIRWGLYDERLSQREGGKEGGREGGGEGGREGGR